MEAWAKHLPRICKARLLFTLFALIAIWPIRVASRSRERTTGTGCFPAIFQPHDATKPDVRDTSGF